MQTFKTRFNYFYFFLIFLGFLFFIGIAFFYFFYGFPLIISGEKNKVPMYIGLTAASVGIIYMIYYCGALLKSYRNILTVQEDKVIVKDAIFGTISEIEIWYIEGYRIKNYIFTENLICLEMWLKNGEKVQAMNYMLANFKGLAVALNQIGIKQID